MLFSTQCAAFSIPCRIWRLVCPGESGREYDRAGKVDFWSLDGDRSDEGARIAEMQGNVTLGEIACRDGRGLL